MRNVPIRTISPATPDAVVRAVAEAGAKGQHIEVIGGGTKRAIGVLGAADLVVSTAGLNRVIDYAPDELVLTAQPGIRIADLETLVAGCGQINQGEAPGLMLATAHFVKPECVTVELQRSFEVGDADHGVQVFHRAALRESGWDLIVQPIRQ